ncbi:MAG: CDP-diacylglycerol--serine O-phosphatidyltransferase [Deltaproteobacteria bacterium RIFCSPLOWO2_12_FULL_44_12]|nr:MAG: CDP-diacylglycerol--serine O-phosphatidyltransferase [Deltaproteobacteria bacterium RIFCSPHIGHO2_01_FULL_43_49]OGQ15736.1 MAG: CDP-diacylglycerol--serine O-phosphatidyltransferase [Deltaproteobacteria bacterium RIFCSPHIGHO2_02_FULL_44_53]OGQ28705.1 MAG: CDP-diacylglycerol--serine O-phosphatidyltransferase [Deltaproteobacteria bacterium RIFCSPHIGHO2_12_FULL_44_21]OGQ32028.1 MAG: CDP-diacylglycerol--serine O-phosphatidyltransferase [Deltaproteobacteria bacterium RIFCSPLOWO2_01_FULL_45_74]
MRPLKRRISRREGVKKGVYLLPNLCTTASLFCGFFSVIKVLHGEFVTASWAILLAGVFDMFDGRLARLTRGGSQFGVEYDSLVDLASFGLAPGILIYTWALHHFSRLGWIVSFLFFACGALRLARYNVQADSVEYKYFQGLPIPMSAYVLATAVIFYDGQYGMLPVRNHWILLLTFLLALLMVSTVRYQSTKQWDLKSRLSFFALVGAAGVIAVIAWEPTIMMLLASLAYVASGPLEELYWWLRQGKRPENIPVPKQPRSSLSLVATKQSTVDQK